jgi:signal transduction histidine kinase
LLEHLEQSFESQKSFIAHASHELRTPITTILGEAEITLINDRQKDEYKASLLNIIKETERLSYIVNSLMDLIQTNVANHEFQSIKIDEIFWEVSGGLSSENLKITYNLPLNPLKYTIQGNRQLLFIAITNIIKNAIKFSDDEEIHCEVFCDDAGINIIIRDQGIGIGQADINSIFQPFFRAPNALSYSGYGIGLSLTYNILRLHNGTIKVTSELDKGTEFHITLPVNP